MMVLIDFQFPKQSFSMQVVCPLGKQLIQVVKIFQRKQFKTFCCFQAFVNDVFWNWANHLYIYQVSLLPWRVSRVLSAPMEIVVDQGLTLLGKGNRWAHFRVESTWKQ